jgi:Domain of unknown function (DUF4384)/PEGA domain
MRDYVEKESLMKKLMMLVGFLVLSVVAYAQPKIVISPQSIVINPKPAFKVEVFVDKDTSGNASPSYNIGDPISIGVRVAEASYVYLFNIKSTGQVNQLIPNRYDADGKNNYLQASETRYFPPRNARYTFNIDGPNGLEKVIAVASRTALDTSQLANFNSDPTFASSNIGEAGFQQTFSIVITPVAQNDWVTDTVLFYVGGTPAPAFGTVSVTSSPAGAETYVDGQFVGYTPVSYGTRTGSHTVEVRLGGYDNYSTSVNVPGGQSVNVNASLVQTSRNGMVTFTSQPAGAQVYVNGTYVGTTPTPAFSYPEGTYQVRFTLAGYNEANLSVAVARNSNQTVRADLPTLSGSLRIRANIGGAIVYLNGQQVGTVPNGTGEVNIANLPAGTHELVVIAPGFRTYVADFTIRGGQTSEVIVQQVRR